MQVYNMLCKLKKHLRTWCIAFIIKMRDTWRSDHIVSEQLVISFSTNFSVCEAFLQERWLCTSNFKEIPVIKVYEKKTFVKCLPRVWKEKWLINSKRQILLQWNLNYFDVSRRWGHSNTGRDEQWCASVQCTRNFLIFRLVCKKFIRTCTSITSLHSAEVIIMWCIFYC